MEVVTAVEKDFAAWLALAREVEDLFGPMASEESFQKALREVIAAKQAFCIRENSGAESSPLCGGIVISTMENEVAWFVVAKKYQQQGIGKVMLSYALGRLDRNKPISVTTFDETVPEGLAARRLYLKYGFTDKEKRGNNPAGVPVVLMTLSR